MNNPQIIIEENDYTTNDGRWEDENWVNEQAELSACEDFNEKGLI